MRFACMACSPINKACTCSYLKNFKQAANLSVSSLLARTHMTFKRITGAMK